MNLSFKIKDLLFICLIFLGNIIFAQSETCFKTGAERSELYLPLLKDKNIIVVTNQTGIIKVFPKSYYELIKDPNVGCVKQAPQKMSIVDFLVENNIKIKSIFAPEHGFRGDADAGEHVQNGIDKKTGIPIVSLYGNNKKPTSEQLKDADIILFDIQDVGVRFYTYISTLTYVMEAAAENNVEVMVLDRPNPHDGYIDGPVLKKQWTSFIGMHEVPVVYGLTIGEYGKMVNGEKWLKNGVQAKYTLIPMLNYHKTERYGMLEKPSPNLPNDKAINLYPSLCFFEGTQVSVGRGTDFPFQVFGSPYLWGETTVISKSKDGETIKNDVQLYQFHFTPKPNFGAKDPFLNGKECYGENLSGYPEDLRKLNLEWLLKAYKNYKNPQQDFFLKNLFFDKLAGTDELRKQIIAEKSKKEIRDSWKADLERFQKIRGKYIVYPD